MANNWNLNQIPIAGDTVTFSINNTYVVTFTGTEASDSATISNNASVSFRSNAATARTYNLTTGAADLTVSTGGLEIGTAALPMIVNVGGTVTVSSGQITVDGASSALNATGTGIVVQLGPGAATGRLVFENGAQGALGTNGGQTQVGISVNPSGHGALTVQSGADVDTGGLSVATTVSGGSGNILVSGVGSTLEQTLANATLTVGNTTSGDGTVTIDPGGTFSSGTGAITVNKTGLIFVNGGISDDATFNANGDITVNGGEIRLGNANSIFNLAAGKNMTLNSAGRLITTNNSLGIGNGGTVTINSDSDLSVSGNLNIGNGTLIVDGVGSTANGGFGFGANGSTGPANVTYRNFATGSFSPTGPFNISVGSGTNNVATVRVESGADLSNLGNVDVGTNGAAGSSGTLIITGSSSTVTQVASGDIDIGALTGTGTTGVLRLENSGRLTTGNNTTKINPRGELVIAGGTLDANGNILIDGGLLQRTSGALDWANAKTMEIKNGGRFHHTSSYTVPPDATVTVTGAGSEFKTLSAGILTINDGATVTATLGANVTSSSTLNVATFNGDSSLTLSGDNTTLNAGSMNVGGSVFAGRLILTNKARGSTGGIAVPVVGSTAANGEVRLESGATLQVTGQISLGVPENAGNDGTILIDGIGSALTQTANTTIIGSSAPEAAGTGTLTVSNQGSFTTSGTTLRKTGVINVNAGNAALGTLTFDGGLINFTSGKLSFGGDLTIGPGGALGGGDLALGPDKELSLTGTTTINSGRKVTLSGGTFTTGGLVTNGVFQFQSGNLRVTGPGGLTLGGGGPLGSSVTLPLGSTIDVSATTTVNSGSQLTVDGGSFASGQLNNSGTVFFDRGSAAVTASITNQATGRLLIGEHLAAQLNGALTNAGRIELLGGDARIEGTGNLVNQGLIRGEGSVTKPLQNQSTGEVRAEDGKHLQFQTISAPNSGRITLQGGSLQFGSALTNAAAGIISGRGTLFFDGGLTNAGRMQFSGGPTDIYGNVTFTGGAGGGEMINSGSGNVVTFYGNVTHGGDEIRTSPTNTTVFFGNVNGTGPFTGPGAVRFEGTFSPGLSPAEVSMEGSAELSGDARLVMELDGTVPGDQHDQLEVEGLLSLGGKLEVTLLDGFTPRYGDAFDLLDFGSLIGRFDTLSLPVLDAALAWDTSALYSTGTITAVPEPAGWMLLLGGIFFTAAGSIARRHSKRFA